jgi:hypothetical protein
MSRILTGANRDAVIAVADGTYLEIQKSTNYDLQKRTYFMQKHYNSVKPMFFTAPKGYILEAHGVYYADSKNNEAFFCVVYLPIQIYIFINLFFHANNVLFSFVYMC